MNKNVLVIIPAYNEADNIEKVVNHIKVDYPEYQYVVVNDGSSDETRNICQKNNYEFINLSINLGIGGAVQTGYKYARDKGFDMAVQLDGDGQHDVAHLGQMIKLMESEKADIVIGSRFIEKEGFQSSAARRFGINFLSILIWILTGKRIKDVTSGYRLVNKKFIDIYAEDYPTDYPEPEAIIQAIMHGGKIKECPVVMRERIAGKSSIYLFATVYYMIKVTLAIIVRRISYGVRRGRKDKNDLN